MSRNGAAWASLVAGAGSTATLPIAVYLTRFLASYELLDAGWTIPIGIVLGVGAVVFARRSRRQRPLGLGRVGAGAGLARAGRLLGILGLCLASAALVSLAVYGLLEYQGSRD